LIFEKGRRNDRSEVTTRASFSPIIHHFVR